MQLALRALQALVARAEEGVRTRRRRGLLVALDGFEEQFLSVDEQRNNVFADGMFRKAAAHLGKITSSLGGHSHDEAVGAVNNLNGVAVTCVDLLHGVCRCCKAAIPAGHWPAPTSAHAAVGQHGCHSILATTQLLQAGDEAGAVPLQRGAQPGEDALLLAAGISPGHQCPDAESPARQEQVSTQHRRRPPAEAGGRGDADAACCDAGLPGQRPRTVPGRAG